MSTNQVARGDIIDWVNVSGGAVVSGGGVRAALQDLRLGLVDNWIRHVKDVRFLHKTLLDQVAPERRLNALVELNVLEQARNVCHTTAVQEAWERGQEVVIHGWVYGLHNGLLEDLRMTVSGIDDIEPAHARAVEAVRQRLGDRVVELEFASGEMRTPALTSTSSKNCAGG